jgi:predicted short-subunit dehydrogenase-like oxidoreductase (DUF2520 family)
MTHSFKHISIVGSGHAANFFGKLFVSKGLHIDCVISRNAKSGKALAEKLNSKFLLKSEESIQSDLMILCLKDDAIAEFINQCQISESTLVAHCAGSVSMDVLNRIKHRSVIYPLQSLKGEVNENEVPFLIEAAERKDLEFLTEFMQTSGLNFQICNSEKRKEYHLAAVFANNFTNAILSATESLSAEFQLDFELLKPLITKTFKSVVDGKSAIEHQTGPAKRKDKDTLFSHLKMLDTNKDLQKLYEALSMYIQSLDKD